MFKHAVRTKSVFSVLGSINGVNGPRIEHKQSKAKMSLKLKYFKNGWAGEWEVRNTTAVAPPKCILTGKEETYTDPFRLANIGHETTFSFKGTDPLGQEWESFHRMFSLVVETNHDLEIWWGQDSSKNAVIHFSEAGPCDVGNVFLTLGTEKCGVLGLILDDGKIGESRMIWRSYYDKWPPRDAAAAAAPTPTV